MGRRPWLSRRRVGVFLYGGFEWVTTSAEEVRAPGLVPKGMLPPADRRL